MAKLTKAEVRTRIDEWAAATAKLQRMEKTRDAELAVEHGLTMQPIIDRHEPKLAPVRAKAAALEAEILEWLGTQGKDITVEGEAAVAANELKTGNRSVPARSFFDAVRDKSEAFWECVTIGIAKAETLLGKNRIDAMAVKQTKLVATVKLK